MTFNQARTMVARVLLVLCLLWPLAHMALAVNLGFSSWRFFGWGMYATPLPAVSDSLTLFVVSDEVDLSSIPDCDEDRWISYRLPGRYRVSLNVLSTGGGDEITLTPDPLAGPVLASEIRRALVLPSPEAVAAVAELLTAGQVGIRRNAVVVISRARFHPSSGMVYMDNQLYRTSTQGTSHLQTVSTRKQNLAPTLCQQLAAVK